MRQNHASELNGVISVHRSVPGLRRRNVIMWAYNVFLCKAKAIKYHYQQLHAELLHIVGDCIRNCVLYQGSVLNSWLLVIGK